MDNNTLTELEEKLVGLVRLSLSDELRKPKYRTHPDPMGGHCYVASEAFFYLTNSISSDPWEPAFIRHENEPHWFLRKKRNKNVILDITASQFKTKVPYDKARRVAFLTKQPSKRALVVIRSVLSKIKG